MLRARVSVLSVAIGRTRYRARMLRRGWFALPLLVLFACGGALADGRADFKKGRYPQAREAFVGAEAESRTWGDGKRAEYALYRGLTHGALGDRAAAVLWLREAKAIEDARPGTLGRDDRTRLDMALESLDPMTHAPSP